MTAHDELLPCPFCGNEATFTERHWEDPSGSGERGVSVSVGCGPCRVEIAEEYDCDRDVVAVWNRRALLAKPEAGDREKRIEAAIREHHVACEGGAPADGELVAAAEDFLTYVVDCGAMSSVRTDKVEEFEAVLAAVRARGGDRG